MGGMTLNSTQLKCENQEDEWVKAQIELRIVDLTTHLITHGVTFGKWDGGALACGDLLRMGMLERRNSDDDFLYAVTEQGKQWLERVNGK